MGLGCAEARGWCLEDLRDDPSLSHQARRGSGPAGGFHRVRLNKLLVQSWVWWSPALEPEICSPWRAQHNHKIHFQPRNRCQGQSSALQPLLNPETTQGWGQSQAQPPQNAQTHGGQGNSQHFTCLELSEHGQGLESSSGISPGSLPAGIKILKVMGDHRHIMQTALCIIIMQIEMDNQL